MFLKVHLLILLRTVRAYLASVILQMGQSLEAFFQWKSLVSLFLGCTEAVSIGLHSIASLILLCVNIRMSDGISPTLVGFEIG